VRGRERRVPRLPCGPGFRDRDHRAILEPDGEADAEAHAEAHSYA
jgi:hypothetical protein